MCAGARSRRRSASRASCRRVHNWGTLRPSCAAISASTCQNRFSRRTLVATPCSRSERARGAWCRGSAPVGSGHMAVRWVKKQQPGHIGPAPGLASSTHSPLGAYCAQPWLMRVPSRARNCASQAGCAGQAGALTRLPSVTAWSTAISAYTPPASSTSARQAG